MERMISFGKDGAELPSTKLVMRYYKASSENNGPKSNVSYGDVWTEYHEMTWESIEAVAKHKVHHKSCLRSTTLCFSKLMQRVDAHFSYGIANNLVIQNISIASTGLILLRQNYQTHEILKYTLCMVLEFLQKDHMFINCPFKHVNLYKGVPPCPT